MGNPLVAPVESSTKAYSGISLFETAAGLKTALEGGGWASVAMGAVGTAMAAVSAVMDPFGAILAAGVGWLMEHVGPLKEALDALAGNADQIAAHSQTWKNVANELGSIGQDLRQMVTADLPSWSGQAADEYRRQAQDLTALLASAQEASDGVSSAVKTAGEVVGAVRTLVRDIIAQLVGHMISWALQVVFTLGIGLAWVVPQVVSAVAKTAADIAQIVRRLTEAMKALVPLLKRTGSLFQDVSKAMRVKKGGVQAPTKPRDLGPAPTAAPTKAASADLPSPKPPSSETPPVSAPPKVGGDSPVSAPPKVGGDSTVSAPPKVGGDSTVASAADTPAPGPAASAAPAPKPSVTESGGLDTSPQLSRGPAGATTSRSLGATTSRGLDGTTSRGLDTTTASGARGGTGPAAGDVRSTAIKDANSAPRANDTATADRLACGDPIDVSTGRVMLTQEDVRLEAALPLVLVRTHLSSYRLGRSFGASWASTMDQRVEVDEDGLRFAAEDGTFLEYPVPVLAADVLPVTGPRWPLRRAMDGSYLIVQPEHRRALVFSGVSGRLVAIGDQAGYQYVQFDYDDAGVPTAITHSAGHRIVVETDGGVVTALTLVSGGRPLELVRYGYDDGQLSEVLNSSGLGLRFAYDAEGRLARWDDRNGMWYRYYYDTQGRCVRTEGRDGHLDYSLSYEPGRTVAVDSLGNTSVFELNAAYQVVAVTDPLGATTRLGWDDHDQMLARTDPLGNTTRYHYDDNGDLVSVVEPDGARTTMDYDDERRPVRLVEPDGSVWQREYTSDGDVAALVDPLGARTEFSYARPGLISAATDPLGNTTRYEYDDAGLLVSVTDPLGAVSRFGYDRFGRLTTQTGPLGAITHNAWTVEGAPLARTLPDGTKLRFLHDGEGNLCEVDDGTTTMRTFFAGFDRPVVQVATDGSRVELAYDTESRVTAVRNAQGLQWRYEYDSAGRLTADTDFNGRRHTYQYDAAGQLIEQVNAMGQVLRFARDSRGRIVRCESDGVVTTYEYDSAGRLLHAQSPEADLRFAYDGAGRVVAETVNDRTVSSVYDAAGQRTVRVTPTAARSEWSYDAAGRLTRLDTAGRTVSFRYDAVGREVERHLGAAQLRQTWDARDRLVTQTLLTSTGKEAQRRVFSYHKDGSVLSVDDALSGPRTLRRDAATRPLAVHNGDLHESYAYDPGGNLTQPGNRVYNGMLLSRDDTAEYEYDAEGRLVVRRTGPSTAWHYRWDAEDRLVAVVTPQGQHWRYRYDPLGRRIAKELADEAGRVRTRTEFAWDGNQLAEEVADGVRATVWHSEPRSGRMLTQTERMLHQGSRQWQDQTFHCLVTDLAGAPTELVDPEQGLVWHGRLALWGAAPAGMPTPLRFPGQYHDQETGLHYNVHRYYDPQTARYLTADPMGLEPSVNPYAYVTDPVSWADPLGLAPCDFNQAHNTPYGPSVNVRGPRKSRAPGATPNWVRDGERWDDITHAAGVPNPYKQRLTFTGDAQTIMENNPGLGRQMHAYAYEEGMVPYNYRDAQSIEALGRNDPNTRQFWEQQDRRDHHTATQWADRVDRYQPDPYRYDNIDATLASVPPDRVSGAQALLNQYDGIVVGGAHGPGHPAFQLMRNNMDDLKNSGVNKLYLESLRDDAYGAQMRNYLNSRPGSPMDPELERYINSNPNNRMVGEIADEARRVGGMDMIGIGGNPARRTAIGEEGLYERHGMLNGYGAESIEYHQRVNGGKYVVEVGMAHGQPHAWSGPPVQHGGVNLPFTSPGMGDVLGIPQVTTNEAGALTRIDDTPIHLGPWQPPQ